MIAEKHNVFCSLAAAVAVAERFCQVIVSHDGELGIIINGRQCSDSHGVLFQWCTWSVQATSLCVNHPDVVHTSRLCTSAAKGDYTKCAPLLASGFRCTCVTQSSTSCVSLLVSSPES